MFSSRRLAAGELAARLEVSAGKHRGQPACVPPVRPIGAPADRRHWGRTLSSPPSAQMRVKWQANGPAGAIKLCARVPG